MLHEIFLHFSRQNRSLFRCATKFTLYTFLVLIILDLHTVWTFDKLICIDNLVTKSSIHRARLIFQSRTKNEKQSNNRIAFGSCFYFRIGSNRVRNDDKKYTCYRACKCAEK